MISRLSWGGFPRLQQPKLTVTTLTHQVSRQNSQSAFPQVASPSIFQEVKTDRNILINSGGYSPIFLGDFFGKKMALIYEGWLSHAEDK
jgi:hypothetical protein